MQDLINKLFTLNNYQLNKVSDYINELLNPKKHRSISQNAYMWQLINQISAVVNKSKEDVYLEMLKDYGVSEIVSMLSTINPKGFFKYYEEIGKGLVNNKEFTHYKLFKGSSEYNSKEMSVLIDGVIQEAENLGIPTLTKEEIEKMRII